jgi:predicted GH43/DUF377 family glycosyl hydrolase
MHTRLAPVLLPLFAALLSALGGCQGGTLQVSAYDSSLTEDTYEKSSSSSGSSGNTKVDICHREGNGSSHTITVSSSAVPAHEAHGDQLCACEKVGTFFADLDLDGYGNPASSLQSCAASTGYVPDHTDCDDTRASVHPGAIELCDDLDNNCDARIDEGFAKGPWYPDVDRDGYGDRLRGVMSCAQPAGSITNGGDCDDVDGAVNPLAVEQCDGRDNDCNDRIDETDEDGDGFSPCDADLRDCDDLRDAVRPGQPELCNGADDDCDGIVDNGFDADGDGFSRCEGDCLDNDPARFPIVTDGWLEYLCSPVLATTPDFDSQYTDQASILVDPASEAQRYRAWYRYGDSLNTRIGLAVSADGFSWTRLGKVLELGAPGAFDDARLVYPTVLVHGGQYHMWYAGYSDATARFAIGYATSQDGVVWTRVDGDPSTSIIDPVLAPGTAGIDTKSAQAPSVIFNPGDGLFYLWYGATEGSVIQVALATSPDGVHWTKKGVVLPVTPGAWDSSRVNFPRVFDAGDHLEMLYAGSNVPSAGTRIGYATSPDGVTWTKSAANPVISPVGGAAWNGYTIYSPANLIQLDSLSREVYSSFVGAGPSAGPFQTGLYTNLVPFATLTAPFDGTPYHAADSIPVQAKIDEPFEVGQVNVTLYSDGALVASGHPAADGYIRLPVTLPAGAHTLSLVATDSGGLTSTDTLTVVIAP